MMFFVFLFLGSTISRAFEHLRVFYRKASAKEMIASSCLGLINYALLLMLGCIQLKTNVFHGKC